MNLAQVTRSTDCTEHQMEESGVWNGVLVLSSCTCGVILVSILIRRE